MSEPSGGREEIRFGGGLSLRARVDFELYQQLARVRRRLYGPTWFEVLEAAYLSLTATPEGKAYYGDPEGGATVAQASRVIPTLTGITPIVLLAKSDLPIETREIENLVVMSRHEIVELLHRLYAIEPHAGVQTSYHDGQIGHFICLTGCESNDFIYVDSWPGNSLLCKGNNAAGIEAKHEGRQWRVPGADLERVIVASFLFPSYWLRVHGDEYRKTYAEFQASEFWKFFRIREAGRTRQEAEGTSVALLTGGFQTETSMIVGLARGQYVDYAELRLRRRWIGDGTNPLALDLAKSFVSTFVPLHDAERAAPFVRALRGMRNPPRLMDELRRAPAQVAEFIAAYTGLNRDIVDLPFQVSSLRIQSDGEPPDARAILSVSTY